MAEGAVQKQKGAANKSKASHSREACVVVCARVWVYCAACGNRAVCASLAREFVDLDLAHMRW